jgi:hypothetical protein
MKIMDISFADKAATSSSPRLVGGYTRRRYQVSCILDHSLWAALVSIPIWSNAQTLLSPPSPLLDATASNNDSDRRLLVLGLMAASDTGMAISFRSFRRQVDAT